MIQGNWFAFDESEFVSIIMKSRSEEVMDCLE